VNSLGAEALWFQICMREQETSESGMTSEQQSRVTAVIEEARRIVGSDVDVYISPLNFYSENTCSATGPYGVSNSAELADWAAATGLAYRGPDTGPLDSSMLVADQCHLNGSGMDFVGQQMVSFFDNGNVVILPPDPDPDPDPTPDPDPVPDPKPNPDPVPTPDPDPSGKPTANFSYTPTTVTAGQPVHLTDQSVDDGLIVKLRWLISDGSVYYDQNPTHTFAKSGTYKVKFQVIDNDGNRATVVKTVVVQ
jgi:PKD repeat protein